MEEKHSGLTLTALDAWARQNYCTPVEHAAREEVRRRILLLSMSSCQWWSSERRDKDVLKISGDLYLSDCVELIDLPSDLYVDGNLYLNGCKKLELLPPNLHVTGRIYFYREEEKI